MRADAAVGLIQSSVREGLPVSSPRRTPISAIIRSASIERLFVERARVARVLSAIALAPKMLDRRSLVGHFCLRDLGRFDPGVTLF